MKGFTLLELMVVMAIVLILTAVAVPQYKDMKARAFDARALSDLRNVAISEEVYYLDSEQYLSCSNDTCAELPGIAALSNGVELSIEARETDFSGRASHEKGSGRVFRWESAEGGLLAES